MTEHQKERAIRQAEVNIRHVKGVMSRLVERRRAGYIPQARYDERSEKLFTWWQREEKTLKGLRGETEPKTP